MNWTEKQQKVFEDDDEAAELWEAQGVRPDHISRLGVEEDYMKRVRRYI